MRKPWFVLALCASSLLFAQEKVDEATDARMRSEEMEHSQLMHTLHMLADRYGPRVTGTPNHEAAARWVIEETTRWGFKNGHLESWDFGHPGWLNESAFGFIVGPVRQNLKFEVLAWTPSTNGTITASAVQLELPHGPQIAPPADAAGGGSRGGRGGPQYQQPTKEELDSWLAANRDKIRGRAVMIGKAAIIPVSFAALEKRIPDDRVAAMYDPDESQRRQRAWQLRRRRARGRAAGTNDGARSVRGRRRVANLRRSRAAHAGCGASGRHHRGAAALCLRSLQDHPDGDCTQRRLRPHGAAIGGGEA